jgi:PKHD-type hydroxylase
MYYAIADVLDADGLREAREVLSGAKFVDGKVTAGWHARLVKNNLQASAKDARVAALRETVAQKIRENAVFKLIVRPKALTPLILSRYEPGMEYGSHVDDALMNGMRTDVSFTLFLSDPDSYAGGELVIEGPDGESDVKLPAGSLVAYPSTTLHRVAPVTEGARLAAVGWARSFIRDAARRELLLDLDTARQSLFARYGKTAEFDLISKTSANLMRLWAED